MPASVPQHRTRADARANRELLLAAARELYAARGLDVSYDEIAREAHVGRATLYRHFPTRELLLAGILDTMLDELTDAALSLPDTPESFHTLFAAAARLQAHNLPLVELIATANIPAQRTAQARRRLDGLFRDRLAHAQAAGLVRPELTPADVRTLLVMLSSLARDTDARRHRGWELVQLLLAGR